MDLGITTTLTGLAVLTGLAGLFAFRMRTRASAGFWSHPERAVPTAIVAGAIVSGALTSPLAGEWINARGVLHLAYLVLTISIPITGLGIALSQFIRGHAVSGVVSLLLLVPAAIGVYATHVGPYRLEIERATLALDPERAGDDTITIGVIADIQTGRVTSFERNAVDRLNELDPDLILVAGDLFDGDRDDRERYQPEFAALMDRLDAPGGVYVVRGDSESPEELDALVAGADVEVLVNETRRVRIGDRRLLIAGTAVGANAKAGRRMYEDLADEPESSVVIVLDHRPDAVLVMGPSARPDLTVSGHTHGGQLQIPGVGALLTYSDVPREVASGGLHVVDGNSVYVSIGIGMVRGQAPQLRLWAPPTIGLITVADG